MRVPFVKRNGRCVSWLQQTRMNVWILFTDGFCQKPVDDFFEGCFPFYDFIMAVERREGKSQKFRENCAFFLLRVKCSRENRRKWRSKYTEANAQKWISNKYLQSIACIWMLDSGLMVEFQRCLNILSCIQIMIYILWFLKLKFHHAVLSFSN